MDGTRRRVVINRGLSMPRAITVDNPEGLGGKIYWTDSLEGTIDYANLDGTGRRSILGRLRVFFVIATVLLMTSSSSFHPPPADLPSPYGIAVSGDFVFWTDWSENTLNRATKTDGNNQQVQLEELEGLAELRLIRKTDLAIIGMLALWSCDFHPIRQLESDPSLVSVFATVNYCPSFILPFLFFPPSFPLPFPLSLLLSFSPSLPPSPDSFDHPCERDQGCSDLCLPNQGVRKFTCACPTGITLKDDTYCPNCTSCNL